MNASREFLAVALAQIQEADAHLQAKPGSSEAMGLLRFAARNLACLPEDWRPAALTVLKSVTAAESSLLGKAGFSPALGALRRAILSLRAAVEDQSQGSSNVSC
jgi:hypothetical protein